MGDLLILDARAVDAEPQLVVSPGEDVRAHAGLGNVSVVAISFPKFRDGRGYSSARILREAGFAGDIRAVGDVTLDQIVFLKRSGFSSVLPDKTIPVALADAALARFPAVYQRAADDAVPVWSLRNI